MKIQYSQFSQKTVTSQRRTTLNFIAKFRFQVSPGLIIQLRKDFLCWHAKRYCDKELLF